MFYRNQPEADIATSKICWSFAPLKLFRRSLIEDIRFPSDMPEDIPFVLEAYLRAARISVAADYAYYHVSFDPERDHASVTSWGNPHSSVRIYQRILDLQERYSKTDQELSVVWRRVVERDVKRSLEACSGSDVVLSSEELAVFSACVKRWLHAGPDEELAKRITGMLNGASAVCA